MKKIICLFLVGVMIFALASCGNESKETTIASDSAENTTLDVNSVTPEVTFTCEKNEVAPGEEISAFIYVKNAPQTACFDMYVYADNRLECDKIKCGYVENFQLEANRLSDADGNKYVAVRGMVATCRDILDDDICTLTYKIPADAASGDKYEITMKCPVYQIAFDENGNEIANCADKISPVTLEFVVI